MTSTGVHIYIIIHLYLGNAGVIAGAVIAVIVVLVIAGGITAAVVYFIVSYKMYISVTIET